MAGREPSPLRRNIKGGYISLIRKDVGATLFEIVQAERVRICPALCDSIAATNSNDIKVLLRPRHARRAPSTWIKTVAGVQMRRILSATWPE